MAFLPQEVALFIVANTTGFFVTRYGPRAVLGAGMGALATGALLISRMTPAGGYMDSVFPGFIFLGIAIGTIGVASSISATMGVAQLQHGLAAGIYNTGNQISRALSLAILTAVSGARTHALLAGGTGVTEAPTRDRR